MAYTPGADTAIAVGAHEVLLAIAGRTIAPLDALVWRPPYLIHNARAAGAGYPAEADVRNGVVYGDREQFEGEMTGGGEVSVVF
jgi:hypothetical protein